MKDLFGRTLTLSAQGYNYQAFAEAEDGYEWSSGDQWEVTEDTPQIEQPKRFLIQLMPYQLGSIYSMIQMETYKCFVTATKEYFSPVFKLSNDMGSGKSATILGLIAASPVPCNGPYYPVTVDHYSNLTTKQSGGAPRALLTRSYTTVYRPAIIFVGYGVVNQWSGEVTKFTGGGPDYSDSEYTVVQDMRRKLKQPLLEYKWDKKLGRYYSPVGMRIMVVDGIGPLKRFYRLMHTKDINYYDAVIVKNKDITGQWEWLHDEVEEGIIDRKGARKIWNMVAVICRNMCFTRLVADDFDTIGMPPIAGNINALATWLVSSTQAEISGRTWQNTDHATVEAMVHHNNVIFAQIMKNQVIHDLFNVHVSKDYIKKYMSVGRPRYFYYKFANAAGKVLDLINCMAGDKVSEIMEALNGDAVGEAARLAGIEASDPNQIFKALLQANYDRLAEAKEVLGHFEDYFNTIDIDSLPPYSENPNNEGEDKDTYTRKDVRRRRPLEWRYPGVRQLLDEEEKKWQDQFDECSRCLQKFKASVKSNECTVCSCELDDPDENYAIMPCCNEVLHADCAVRGCAFQKEHTRDGIAIVGRCPFDKSHRVKWSDMTYIKGSFDLSRIDEDRILEKDEDADVDDAPVETAFAPKKKKRDGPRNKYDAIIEIVRGLQPEEQTPISLQVPSVMQGRKHLGDPEWLAQAPKVRADMEAAGVGDVVADQLMARLFPQWTPKTLIFASFDEALQKTEQRLTEEGVRWMRLGGTAEAMRQQIDAFWKGDVDVLTIKSTTHCSSLNLQCADNLIFMHQIIDSHIMRQVLGRIQRAGRLKDARVHWMLHENEVPSLDPYKVEEVADEPDEPEEEEEKPKKKKAKKVKVESDEDEDDEEDEDEEEKPKRKAKRVAKAKKAKKRDDSDDE
jgi:hypothetical protein